MFRLWNYIFNQNNEGSQSDVNQEETEDEEPDDQEGSSSDEEESVDKSQEGVSDI